MPQPKKELNEREELMRAFDTVMSFPEGRVVMLYIYGLTGYGDERLVRQDPQSYEVNMQASLHDLGRRDMWGAIRRLMAPEDRSKIENEVV